MKRISGFIVFFLINVIIGFSQDIRIIHLPSDESRGKFNFSEGLLRTSAIVDTLKGLPFFDDFTTTHRNPDKKFWIDEGGTYVNNTFPVNPPSYNVATFDGLDRSGRPYSSTIAKGVADRLTSIPIDLSLFKVEDSLYLSFWWQAAGNGEKPEPEDNDKLILEFKDPYINTKWNQIWEMRKDSSPFELVMIPLKIKEYLYKGFQFRFTSYGSKYEMSDIWNLDYVYLNSNRTINDPYTKDLSIVSAPRTIFENFTSVPYKHLSALNIKFRQSFSLQVKNLWGPGTVPMTYNDDPATPNIVKDLYKNEVIDTLKGESSILDPQITKTVPLSFNFQHLQSLDRPLYLSYRYSPEFSDDSIFRSNNRIYDSTIISNYYAYDDGTAEALHGISYMGSIVSKYNSPVQDSVIGLMVNFVPVGADYSGKRLTIKILKSITLGKGDEELISARDVELEYNGINGFTSYYFDRPVSVNGDFFIGFEQYVTGDFVDIGYDLNNKNSDKIFYKKAGSWTPFEAPRTEGTLMIRPVFGGSHYQAIPAPVAIKDPRTTILKDVNLYPNPVSDIVYLSGKFTSAEVFDISGLVHKRLSFQDSEGPKEVDVRDMEPGIYFIRVSGENGSAIQKLVITR